MFVGWARYCPICRSWVRSFGQFGVNPRPDARCPVCHSLERHRLVWTFFEKRTDLLDESPKRMLHVAPEPGIEGKLKRVRALEYITADLSNDRALVRMDITDIQYPDESFDVIYNSHVLEHIPDDRTAIRELNRVLKRDGWAVFIVPITADETFEDPSVTNPAERQRLFGQHDHVRRYGPDFKKRLEQANFKVECFTAADLLDARSIARSNPGSEFIFFSRKEHKTTSR